MSVFENKMLIENPADGDTAELLLYNQCDSVAIECKGTGFKFHLEGQQDPIGIQNWTNLSGVSLDGLGLTTDVTAEGIYQYSTGGVNRIRVVVETAGTDLQVHAQATRHSIS